jgi:hypothetical protein
MFHKTTYGLVATVAVTAMAVAGMGLAFAAAPASPAATPANAESVTVPPTYEEMDTDHNMMVSKQEAMAAMPNLNFKAADENGDGELSRVEYIDLQAAVADGTWTNKIAAVQTVAKIPGYDDDPVDVVKKAEKGTLKDPYKTSNATVVKEGHESFLNHGCSSCHGGNGGGGMCPPLDNGVWIYGSDHLDDKLFRLVSLGSQKLQEDGFARAHQETPALMPQQGGVTVTKAGDLWKMITWIKSINIIQD